MCWKNKPVKVLLRPQVPGRGKREGTSEYSSLAVNQRDIKPRFTAFPGVRG
jgi:hypothetical protein